MNREKKIELLKGIADGSIKLMELSVRQDVIVVDESDERDIIKIIRANNDVITPGEYEDLLSKGLLRGFICDARKNKLKTLLINEDNRSI